MKVSGRLWRKMNPPTPLVQRRQRHPSPVLLPGKFHGWRSLVGCKSMGSVRVRHDWVTSLSVFTLHFHALEKEMATHSSVLAWRIPGTGEPGGLPSMGSHKVGHDWSDLAAAAAHCWWECKLVQPLWKTVWSFLIKLKIELPYEPAIPLLLKGIKSQL